MHDYDKGKYYYDVTTVSHQAVHQRNLVMHGR